MKQYLKYVSVFIFFMTFTWFCFAGDNGDSKGGSGEIIKIIRRNKKQESDVKKPLESVFSLKYKVGDCDAGCEGVDEGDSQKTIRKKYIRKWVNCSKADQEEDKADTFQNNRRRQLDRDPSLATFLGLLVEDGEDSDDSHEHRRLRRTTRVQQMDSSGGSSKKTVSWKDLKSDK